MSLFAFCLSNSLVAATPLTGNLELIPEYPKPNEQVTVELTSFAFDVNTTTITWYIAGKKQLEGIGKKRFIVQAGDVGTILPVGVYAKLSSGETFAAEIAIAPLNTLLLTEAVESYVPPFYEGRALPGEGSRVKIVAYPSFSSQGTIDPDVFAYAWQVNDIRQDELSGYGKRTFIFRQDELNEENYITLTATSKEGATSMSTLSVTPYTLSPQFYVSDPILGIDLAKSINNRIEIKQETSLAFVPYFFTYDPQAVLFSWSLNGLPLATEDDFSLHLVPKPKSFGSNEIIVSASNSNKPLQSIKKILQVTFDTR